MERGSEDYSVFRMPKKAVKSIQAEYKAARKAIDEKKKESSLREEAEQLKPILEGVYKVLSAYEEISSRATHRELSRPHVEKWLDEGFEVDEIISYLKKQYSESYFKENPDRYRIAQLLPLLEKENERAFKAVWDSLSYEKSKKDKPTAFSGGLMLKLFCGHEISAADLRAGSLCTECVQTELMVVIDPYEMEKKAFSESLRALAKFFQRSGTEGMGAYMERTKAKREEIYQRSGMLKKKEVEEKFRREHPTKEKRRPTR